MEKPTAYVLVGLPGSGKTTWAKTQPSHLPILSIDTYIEDYAAAQGQPYDQAFMQSYRMAKRWMKERLAEVIEQRRPFIWDHTNLTRVKRLNIFNKLHPTHRVVFVCFCVPVEVCIERAENRERRGGGIVNRETILRWAATASFPEPGEPFDAVIPIIHPSVKEAVVSGQRLPEKDNC